MVKYCYINTEMEYYILYLQHENENESYRDQKNGRDILLQFAQPAGGNGRNGSYRDCYTVVAQLFFYQQNRLIRKR